MSPPLVTSTMQDVPLLIRRLLENGMNLHGSSEVITATATATGTGTRSATYAQVGRDSARLAHALSGLGVQEGDRVATFMWNNQEHLEAYLAVPAMGAVIHPLNIRLFPEQLTYIANHAEDTVVIVDASLLPVFAPLLPEMRTVRHVVVNGEGDTSALSGAGVTVHHYTRLLEGLPETYDWPDLDESRAAGMCYTSGTTGHPKGVVYSHRSLYLHSLGISLPDTMDISGRDRLLVIVPQFHAQAWGLPYAAFLTGASLAMPDRFLAPAPLAEFIAASRPNKGAGVPTVWQGLATHVQQHPEADISSMEEAVVGGSSCPPSLMRTYEEELGIRLLHAWGMTEVSPLGALAREPAGAEGEDAWRHRLSQGRFPAPVEARLIGLGGSELPWDGKSVGELEVRGPWVTGSYYLDDDPEKFHDGWLRTGDVGTITPDGFLTLTDRVKDVIKSGGEWISSVELENHLMAHPDVAEAAVVGVPDDKWGERPLATVVLREGGTAGYEELRAFLAGKVAAWQLPERWVVLEEVPKTSVGKFDKKELRRRYADGVLKADLVGSHKEPRPAAAGTAASQGREA
ncbi:long-chain fatty acid--CoA ligase [Streptomyces sp. S07_1.15]|uniref:long-chain fatty acid--CoA ligase n=1 Tax=Streptomyces sp. S07_1.15 TaxID=2873925 RepID=UPI001D13CD5E|nr:long-chain fatty acid--CoA ligase [Streptomyces sp. S07_1.15]MCC3654333.1 long-chain fatty acid--CoA ligase [Streptomyces sp. S07_1.15]